MSASTLVAFAKCGNICWRVLAKAVSGPKDLLITAGCFSSCSESDSARSVDDALSVELA